MTISNPWYRLASLIAACLVSSVTSDISCHDDNGQPVDWFILYKLPKCVKGHGLLYMYMDHRTSGWRSGKYSINDTRGAVGATLQRLYGRSAARRDDVAYVLYNDQSSVDSNSRGGHTKGVVLLDQKQGFWLVHSTPHFPPKSTESYEWPHSGWKNGQSFLCVTYPYSQFQEIGTQLLYNNPHVYDYLVPPSFAKDLPDLQRAARGKHKKSPPWKRKIALSSAAGKQFISFAKYSNFGADLYSGWVASDLKSDLLAQTWLNSPHALPSNCTAEYAVYNVERIKFPSSINFTTHVDHSKWCVTTGEGGKKWTCIGDINRDQAQEERGGGTVCNDDPVVWDAFSNLVAELQSCECTCSGKVKTRD
ncbi:deoxyribonuclease-2-alpha [Hypanus sabinus]|uniref:deoxyribonuclease-2-alpha n=1 Tax=Hypanus sabinus TaxID=79690 RepID=UPI0028C3B0F4|nr:deoxyribonuclease-2-alpha [Hypanus sabinus]XP_059848331.1 deoxyribonuclease-2-alpha [Hypanus sabinus]